MTKHPFLLILMLISMFLVFKTVRSHFSSDLARFGDLHTIVESSRTAKRLPDTKTLIIIPDTEPIIIDEYTDENMLFRVEMRMIKYNSAFEVPANFKFYKKIDLAKKESITFKNPLDKTQCLTLILDENRKSSPFPSSITLFNRNKDVSFTYTFYHKVAKLISEETAIGPDRAHTYRFDGKLSGEMDWYVY